MLFGQQYPNQPELPFLEDVYTFALLELDNNNLIEEDSIVLAKNNINNTLFYGIFVDLNLNPYQVGKWVEKENSMIWQLKIHSPSAHSLAIVLDSLNLPEGASITIFDQNLNQSIESYTSTYNTLSTLTTPNITGNSLYIELVCPKDKIGEPLLIFKEIIHDYRGVFAEKGFEVAPILPCHIDINCPEGDDWQTHKKSVTMMSYSYTANSIFFGLFRDKRSGISTGAMINNTKFDGKPYFLTAEHNLDLDNLDKYIANIVFYFDYENENCNGNKFSFENTIVGASLKALNKYSDFALLELSTKVPSSYFPYFAGWNRVEDNVTHGIGIHHPKGNPKKISFANNLILPNSSDIYLGGNRIFYTNSVWKVNYDNGTTEVGSSGSPLFNPDGKIIGQLYGKRFSYEMGCPDPQVTKLYGRLSVSWDHGSSSSTRLKEWLDPINSNPDEILGLIPEGWRNDWLTGWNQPPSHKVHPQIKSLAVGEGGQVFYRGTDNKMQSYYFNTSTSTWVHDWVSAHNIPNHEFIDGDVVVGEGNQLFYRGRDGKMQTY